ncbi:hypothetical protein CONLIGDRAFT_504773 [Coniochaeta ligniaria NRRL 30616]|uniref:JmjC domain-containing protein n=1 Tax=Coniochaeta ligniaria NRRL 30616 TaxID=1408157 RepID=A0A1J7J7R0_9PEZI|nr:hypothetical protein CONLIGDRAFT_504773 [Coniochaeta ligniaria NRRL 30616]
MPTTLHPQAKFDPIPPDLDLHELVERTPNFDWVKRISAAQIRNIGQREFEKFVLFHVIQGGKPLVIEKWNDRLPKSLFSAEWLEKTYDKKQENVRDIGNQTDIPMTMGHYLRSMRQLTNQWTPHNFRDERRQRLYLKDIDCPPEWHERLRTILPPNLYYLNENVEDKGSRRTDDEFFIEEKIPAPAGDLMSSLLPEMRAQNLMCYIGHEGTYTPAHREMCASLGQNIMVDASGEENGEKPGSSIWFMTETKDREVVREYFLSMLGHDVEIEKHFAQINAWKKATFPVYIVEQKVGDFILVPPLAPHQVWNRGTRTIKVAWNRTTVETLDLALHEALPKARLVCRDEQYKNKAIIYYTLDKYYKQLADLQATAEMQWLGLGQDLFKDSPRVQQLAKDFKQLLSLFTEILVDEMFATKEKNIEYVEFDSFITCSYCRANIFNRFLTCKHCVRQLANGDEDTYDVCMECYAMGRSCLCVSGLTWCEQWKWSDLVDNYETWRTMVIRSDGYVDFDHSPLPLEIARRKFGKKSVAQICQEQLRKRPFKDITKNEAPSEPEPEEEPAVNDEGRVIKKKRKGRKKKTGDVYTCHVCFHKDYVYKLAFCTTPGCGEAYCYGVLYRAFDLLPQAVMQTENWQCPKCLGICNCGACRRANRGQPYMPKNTLLGHDTRPIADDRSVETLVDFRVHNLSWLKNLGEEGRSSQSKRMQRLQDVAVAEKAKDDELVNALPALPEGQDDSGLGVVRQALENGYGAQEDIINPQIMGEQDMAAPVVQDGQQHDVNGHQPGPAAVADMSIVEDDSVYPEPSSYPDPRMLGMGYYEQDDTPDKILFDPYQAPAENAMDDEPEVSEYVKKALRAAKRRARQEEDDDPDFTVGKSHRKKQKTDETSPFDGQQEALNNMDPALFGHDVAMPEADMGEIEMIQQPQEDAEPVPAQDQAPEAEEPEVDDGLPFSINRPALRHAKPKIAYADANKDEDEFDEVYVPKPKPPAAAKPAAETANTDPLDAASAAVLAITQGASKTASPAPPQPKKRGPGRPRGRPRKSDTSVAPTPTSEKKTSTPQPLGRSRSGRPTRSSLAVEVEPSPSEDDMDAQLAAQLDAFDENGEAIERDPSPAKDSTPATTGPRKRGRPPKNPASTATTKPQATTVAVDVRSSRTGRDSAPATPVDTRFLSMKERMALKGKKIKIAGRKSTDTPASGSATPDTGRASGTPASRTVSRPGTANASAEGRDKEKQTELEAEEDDDFIPGAEEEPVSSPAGNSGLSRASDGSEQESSASPPARRVAAAAKVPVTARPASPPTPAKQAGPTVVRLGDTDEESGNDYDSNAEEDEEEEEEEEASVSASSSEFDDDEIIPAKTAPARAMAVRGGRGGARGRGTVARGRVARRGRG